ncbi:MAG: pilin [Gemmatimonadota bacterium]|nr:pilin [Gemmatimonadota bacterium]
MELLIVVVIIGILAAIAIPKFANTKEKAYIAAMKTDLRNLATAEEGYFADHQNYTLAQTDLNAFQFSPSVSATITSVALAKGWAATSSHTSTAVTCDIAVGTSVTGTYADGQVHCP